MSVFDNPSCQDFPKQALLVCVTLFWLLDQYLSPHLNDEGDDEPRKRLLKTCEVAHTFASPGPVIRDLQQISQVQGNFPDNKSVATPPAAAVWEKPHETDVLLLFAEDSTTLGTPSTNHCSLCT